MLRRMDFEQLLSLQDVLDVKLCFEGMSLVEYELEWLELLLASGYTPRDYELLVDRRWDHLTKNFTVEQANPHRFS